MTKHPSRDMLRRYVIGDLDISQSKRTDRHLSVCSECKNYADQVNRSLAVGCFDSCLSIEYEEALKRAGDRTIERLAAFIEDSRNTEDLLAELLGNTASASHRQAVNDERFHSLRLCQLLQSQCRRLCSSEPASALEIADLAVEISRHLDPVKCGRCVVEDVRALAWAYLGNALRITSEDWSSELALRQAWYHHTQAGEDAYTESELLMFTASLRNDQRRYSEAVQLCDRAISIYREGQDRHLEGAGLILKGLILGNSGLTGEALSVLRGGLDQLDPQIDPRLMFAGYHNLAYFTVKSGLPEKAQKFIDRYRSLFCNLGMIDLAKTHWVEGLIATDVGQFVEAESAMREALDVFQFYDLGSEVFLLSLDLGQLYILGGQYRQVREILGELIPLGEALGFKQEAFMARMLYEAAIRH